MDKRQLCRSRTSGEYLVRWAIPVGRGMNYVGKESGGPIGGKVWGTSEIYTCGAIGPDLTAEDAVSIKYVITWLLNLEAEQTVTVGC